MKRFLPCLLALLVASICLLTSCAGSPVSEEVSDDRLAHVDTGVLQFSEPAEDALIAVFDTSLGEFSAVLYPEETPQAVQNFVTLAREGYYNGLTFHRVLQDFIIQSGDATGTGTGGKTVWGKSFGKETSGLLHCYTGALAMAGGEQNYSQFFVVQCRGDSVPDVQQKQMKELGWADNVIDTYAKIGGAPYLDGNYTVFGQILQGMATVDAIGKVEVDSADKPASDVTLNTVTIVSYSSWKTSHNT